MIKKHRTTLKDVAAEAKCHVTVASKVLNNAKGNTAVSDATRERILEVAKRLGYKPNAMARMMRSQRTGIIGVLVKDYGHGAAHPSTYDDVQGITDELQRSGRIVTLVRVSDLKSEGLFAHRVFQEQILDGIIVVSCSEIAADVPSLIREATPNVIWLNSNIWEENDCICCDEFGSSKMLANYCGDLGYDRIVFINRPEASHYAHADRLAGARSYCDESKIAFELRPLPSRIAASDLRALFDGLTPQTVLMAGSAWLAEDILFQLATTSKAVGADFGFASCGSRLDFNRFFGRLTRFDGERYKKGSAAARMLVGKLEADGAPQPSVRFKAKLVKGQTTRQCR